MRVWDPFLTTRDREIYDAAGYGRKAGFNPRPALLVVDITYDFVGDRPEDIRSSVLRFRRSCGEEGWTAMKRLVPLLSAARQRGIPVMYTVSASGHDVIDRRSWGVKNHRFGDAIPDGLNPNDIPPMIAPLPHEVVIAKTKPSAFVGTPLAEYLVALRVDQLLCCGTVTSGCVRATVVDAFSHNYRVAVVEDCTFDRGQASHAMSLFDMQQWCADVVSSDDAIEYLNGLGNGLFPEWMPEVRT